MTPEQMLALGDALSNLSRDVDRIREEHSPERLRRADRLRRLVDAEIVEIGERIRHTMNVLGYAMDAENAIKAVRVGA